ncbi:MAG: hypothetical protein AUK44_03995 [Porphyromonadaceae bacterium CG2_30_38_12]|nr:MAG: hypothetical protein AUK44_03995 [Porphyromonadaceae bacterium CG2_30_38_12]
MTKKTQKKAIIVGATGMVGTELLKQILESTEYDVVTIFVRKPIDLVHPKLEVFTVDFNTMDSWKHQIQGDVLFLCMGTTLAAAGSKSAQYKVDFSYQYQVAKTAHENGVQHVVVISSAGANSKSSNFYLNTKGSLDDTILSLSFRTVSILRPGQLFGNRSEKRPLEKIALQLMFAINKIGLLRKYRPIHAIQVAKAMQQLAHTERKEIYSLDELFRQF